MLRNFVLWSRFAVIPSSLAMTTGLQAHDDPVHDRSMKVGFVYEGAAGEHAGNLRHDLGREAVEAAFGEQVETTPVEIAPDGGDAERALRRLASDGHDLIFVTSAAFAQATLSVADEFPEVKFEQFAGSERTGNVGTYDVRSYEGRMITGVMAGHMTESGVIGYIASSDTPDVVRGINAFTLATRKANPDAEVKVVWLGSDHDPSAEAAATMFLLGEGADVLTQHTYSSAPLEVAEQQGGVRVFGYASDMASYAPTAHLASIVHEWGDYYSDRVVALSSGEWESTDVWEGVDSGMIQIVRGDAVSDDALDAGDALKLGLDIFDAFSIAAAEAAGEIEPPAAPSNEASDEGINELSATEFVIGMRDALPADVVEALDEGDFDAAARRLHPFVGPIINQAGELVVAAGEVIPDDQLRKMDWFVEGISLEGTLERSGDTPDEAPSDLKASPDEASSN